MERDSYFEYLKRIPMEASYDEHKDAVMSFFNDYLDDNPVDAINFVIFEWLDDEMNEYGMTKAVNIILSALFLKEHNTWDIPICYEAYYDILDLETGEFDDLFAEEDIEQFKADIGIVKEYISKHPDFVKKVEEDRKRNRNS